MLIIFSIIFIIAILFIAGMWFGMSIYQADEEIQKERNDNIKKT